MTGLRLRREYLDQDEMSQLLILVQILIFCDERG